MSQSQVCFASPGSQKSYEPLSRFLPVTFFPAVLQSYAIKMQKKKKLFSAKAPPGTNINEARDHIKALPLSHVLINALRGDAVAYAPFLKRDFTQQLN